MNVSYLTDTEVRREYLRLLQAIDSMLTKDYTTVYDPKVTEAFWESLGYSVAEIPQY
jgi:hypothetical protein